MSPEDRAASEAADATEDADAGFARRIALGWIVLSFALGWVGLGRTPLWIDESIAVFPARGILAHGAPVAPFDMDFMPWQIKFGLWDPATPLYRYCLAAVFAVFGFSEQVARGFSWAVGFGALIPIHAAGRFLFGRTTAWLGVAVIAGSPAFGLFAREGRHHSFVLLMASSMVWALLVAARGHAPPRRRMLWVPPLIGALLAQTIGYIALPLAGLYVSWVGVRRFVSTARSGLIVATAALAAYAAVMVVFWDTLPFFHELGCHNRPAGCRPTPLYYPRALYDLLMPVAGREEFHDFRGPSGAAGRVLAAGPFLFLVGCLAAAVRSRRWPSWRYAMVWIWLLVPPLLLSTQEVKFPRFLFVWTFPVASLLVAFGITQLAHRTRTTLRRRIVLLLLLVVVGLAPRWSRDGPGAAGEQGFSLAWVSYLRERVWNPPRDNWHGTGAQARYLESRVREGDEVVTSFDDAGLQYYLGRFVHGFLNSRHDDAYFMALLREAERRDRVVWFVDTLPDLDFCLSDAAEPVSVPCLQKYPAFYRACLGLDPRWSSRCRLVGRWDVQHGG